MGKLIYQLTYLSDRFHIRFGTENQAIVIQMFDRCSYSSAVHVGRASRRIRTINERFWVESLISYSNFSGFIELVEFISGWRSIYPSQSMQGRWPLLAKFDVKEFSEICDPAFTSFRGDSDFLLIPKSSTFPQWLNSILSLWTIDF